MTTKTLPVHAGRRRILGALTAAITLMLGLASALGAGGVHAAPSGTPIRIGGTLALTGPLAQTALVHRIAGEIAIDQWNAANGLLGRPVEWVLLDDQSKPELARSLYEKLITVDKVDLLMGPYATAAILAAMAVAERHQKTLVHHTMGLPKLAKYERQFSVAANGLSPEQTFPEKLFQGLAESAKPPKSVAFVASKFPSAHFISVGAREAARKRGLKEQLYVEYEFGARDFGPIAARLRDADADFVWLGTLGMESLQIMEAMKKIGYAPKSHFHLLPTSGPLAVNPDSNLALSYTSFEPVLPYLGNPVAATFVREFAQRATKAGLAFPEADNQAGNSYSAWQVLGAAIEGTKSLNDDALAKWLRANKVQAINGLLRFDGENNMGDDLTRVRQLQGGKWVIVAPKEFATPGAKLIVP